jgi:hypothetical protein
METTHFKELLHLVDYFNHNEILDYHKKCNDINFDLNGNEHSKIFGNEFNKITILSSSIGKELISANFSYSKFKENFIFEIEKNLFLTSTIEQKKFILRSYLNQEISTHFVLLN